MNNIDYLEDLSALHEPVLDVEGEMTYLEPDIEYYFTENVNA